MIKISNNVKIKQIIEITNNETNEVEYLVMDDNSKKWERITQKEYNTRGYNNGK